MERRAFWRATALAALLQAGLVFLGMVLPVLHQQNLDPILSTLIAVLAGFLFAWWAPGRALPPALVAGALAGALSSLLGGVLGGILGQASPAPVSAGLIVTLTGAVAGAVGGFFGRLFAPAPAPR